jgi:hypothetical protein
MFPVRILATALLPLCFFFVTEEEAGFKPLLGKTFDGWKAKKGGEILEGKTEAYKGRFTLRDGVLVIDPKVKGDVIIETTRDIKGDVRIRFDFKPGKGCNNDLFFRGQKFDIVPEAGTGKGLAGVQTDEWNTLEIIVVGEAIEFLGNGRSLRKGKTKAAASPFGIRAEFGPMEIRNLRIKEAGTP